MAQVLPTAPHFPITRFHPNQFPEANCWVPHLRSAWKTPFQFQLSHLPVMTHNFCSSAGRPFTVGISPPFQRAPPVA